jgi:MtN3 and saliva related transmembrane protein
VTAWSAEGLADVVGTAAGLCSMASFPPQILKIVREHDANSVSLRMYLITVAGFSLWIAYGVLLNSWPVWGSNAINLALAGAILILKLRYGDRAAREQGLTQAAPTAKPPGA